MQFFSCSAASSNEPYRLAYSKSKHLQFVPRYCLQLYLLIIWTDTSRSALSCIVHRINCRLYVCFVAHTSRRTPQNQSVLSPKSHIFRCIQSLWSTECETYLSSLSSYMEMSGSNPGHETGYHAGDFFLIPLDKFWNSFLKSSMPLSWKLPKTLFRDIPATSNSTPHDTTTRNQHEPGNTFWR